MLLKATSALMYVDLERRGLLEIFSDGAKKEWKRWDVQGLIVFSLILQVILICLGQRRKYMGNRTRTRFLIWSAYLLADWVATVALGVISQNTLDVDGKKYDKGEETPDELKCFWAPFLLLHLGGPDTITAYALEDNELWLRHLVGLVIQVGLVLYILLAAWPGTTWLPALSLAIFMAGITKYSERTLALKSANIENLRDSMLTPPDSGPNYPKFMEEFTLKKAEGYYVEAAEVKELPVPIAHSSKSVSEAYEQFQIFKRLFVDLILSFQDKESSQSYFQTLEPEKAFEVVEVELGFAFDLFYTKAPIVYTVAGRILRVFTLSCTCLALIAFPFVCKKCNYRKIDLIITYLLLVGAILLEIYAVITQIFSDWPDRYWLHMRKKTEDITSSGLSHQGNTQRWQNKIRERMINGLRHQRNGQRWSNLTAQYNLLSFCLEEKPPTFYTLQKLFQIDQIREKHRYKTYKNVTTSLKILIFNQFKKSIEMSEADSKGLGSQSGSFAFKKHLPDWRKDVEFDQRILIWHIATDICYYLEGEESQIDVIPNCRESKQLSDYVMYLLVLHPFLLPIGIGMIRFRDTCAEAKEFFQERGLQKFIACKKLLQVNTEVSPVKVKGDRSKSVLFDACRLAKSLRQTEAKDSRWDTISRVWVEILAYAASHCRGNHHAQNLRKGGELLTHVWLLMAHLGITEHFQINQGHARAKLVTK